MSKKYLLVVLTYLLTSPFAFANMNGVSSEKLVSALLAITLMPLLALIGIVAGLVWLVQGKGSGFWGFWNLAICFSWAAVYFGGANADLSFNGFSVCMLITLGLGIRLFSLAPQEINSPNQTRSDPSKADEHAA